MKVDLWLNEFFIVTEGIFWSKTIYLQFINKAERLKWINAILFFDVQNGNMVFLSMT